MVLVQVPGAESPGKVSQRRKKRADLHGDFFRTGLGSFCPYAR